MNVNANELRAHMQNLGVDKIAVDVVDVNVPDITPAKGGWVKQSPRVLAKRMVITSINAGGALTPPMIRYSMYNSFKKSQSYVPMNFMFSVILGAEQDEIIEEFLKHKAGLEQAFRDAFNTVHENIQHKLDEAHALIKEAEQLSQDHGVPFSPRANIFPCDASFMPDTFKKKFGTEPEVYAVMSDLTGVYDSGETGWDGAWNSSSANC